MTLPASGPISLNNVNVELGLSGTTSINMNQASVRTLFGVPSGAISMSNGYGKANQFSFSISTNQTNANLRSLAIAAGWNSASKVVATINSGIYVSSNSTGTPALTVSGSFPGGVQLINNGLIIGMGGAGGKGAYNTTAGGNGGTALSVSSAISITNNNTIGGGGGGGQGSVAQYIAGCCGTATLTGAGGGGGRSGTTNSAAGASGDPVPGYTTYIYSASGAAGQGTTAGAGGGGYSNNSFAPSYTYGGAGGGWGAGGSAWSGSTIGWSQSFPAGAGSGGAAVSGNSNITWLAFGTRLGAIA